MGYRKIGTRTIVRLVDEREIPDVGESAPEFELVDSAGVVRRLSEIVSGCLGVVVFYRAHWCPFCIRQLADYSARLDDFRAAGAVLVEISVDDAVRAGPE